MQVRNSLMLAALMLLASSPVLAQSMTDDMSQTGPQSVTGARPGNDIGTRNSLPRSPVAANITAADTKSTIAPTPPEPSVGADAGVSALLSSANQSLATGQTGQANEALEQAETQVLQRSVLQTQTDYTSTDPLVAQIDQARQAIGNHDNADATRIINQILSGGSPELSE
jgi:hypothetical protein